MKTATKVEGAIFAGIGVVGMIEGARLSGDTSGLYQMMGPGAYVFLLSLALAVTAVYHMVTHLRHADRPRRETTGEKRATGRVIALTALMAANVFLIYLFGYATALAIFFFVSFRILQVEKWWVNVAVSVTLAAIFHIIFVKLCSVVFPPGLLFG